MTGTETRPKDWIEELFPGEGTQLPADDERDRADALLREWAERWGEHPRTVARTRPVSVGRWVDGKPGAETYQVPTNRAFLRSQIRRWWAKR